MRLARAIRTLTEGGFIVRFEIHPVNPRYIAILLTKDKFTQRGSISFEDFNEDTACNVLMGIQINLSLFHKVRKG